MERGTPCFDVAAQLGEDDIYCWEHGLLWAKTHSGNFQALCTNPTLYRNARSCADSTKRYLVPRKKAVDLARNSSGRGALCCNSFVIAGLQMMIVAADNNKQERPRIMSMRSLMGTCLEHP